MVVVVGAQTESSTTMVVGAYNRRESFTTICALCTVQCMQITLHICVSEIRAFD